MKTILLIIFVLATLLIATSYMAHAQPALPDPGTLPGSPLYGLEKAFEAIGTAFTFGDEAKSKRYLKLAEERLAEAKTLAERGDAKRVEELSTEYEKRIAQAREKAEEARDNQAGRAIEGAAAPKGREDLLELVSQATTRHMQVLDEVEETVPEQAKEGIARAKDASMKGNQDALRALAGKNPEKAAEIAMQVATDRAEKARQAVQEGDTEEAVEAAEEYERYAVFSEEISSIAEQIGEDPSKVEELVAQATSAHLKVLEDVLEIVPEQARESLQNAVSAAGGGSAAAETVSERIPVPEASPDTEEQEVEVPDEIPEEIPGETAGGVPSEIPGGRP